MGKDLYDMVLDRKLTSYLESHISVLGGCVGNPHKETFPGEPYCSGTDMEQQNAQPVFIGNANEFVETRYDTADTLMKMVIGFHAVGPAIILSACLFVATLAHIAAYIVSPFPCDCIIHNPPWG